MSNEPTWGKDAREVTWEDLEPKDASLKFVDGMLMDREQYYTEGWRLEGYYTVSHPHQPGCDQASRTIPIWRASLPTAPSRDEAEPPTRGLRGYAALQQQRRQDRRTSYLAREAEDQSFREYVDSLMDAKPAHPTRSDAT